MQAMKKLLIAMVFGGTCLVSLATYAQERLSVAEQAEARLALQTARSLISYGETKGDALALVTAARMMLAVPGRILADGQAGDAGRDKSVAFDIEILLTKAEQLAKGDEAIAKLVAQTRQTANADAKPSCYWEYYCYYNGWCEYAYACW